jgi:hypothetical protein
MAHTKTTAAKSHGIISSPRPLNLPRGNGGFYFFCAIGADFRFVVHLFALPYAFTGAWDRRRL